MLRSKCSADTPHEAQAGEDKDGQISTGPLKRKSGMEPQAQLNRRRSSIGKALTGNKMSPATRQYLEWAEGEEGTIWTASPGRTQSANEKPVASKHRAADAAFRQGRASKCAGSPKPMDKRGDHVASQAVRTTVNAEDTTSGSGFSKQLII